MRVAVIERLRSVQSLPGAVPAGAMLALTVAAALLAGLAPLGCSIVTVFLFAGPHNWLEARYFLTRLPARWRKLRGFFVVGLAGVLLLTVAFSALPAVFHNFGDTIWSLAVAAWNTALIGWISLLVYLRSRQSPRREWGWTAPIAFVLIAVSWLSPFAVGLALVYGHPLVALWLLDRELKRSRPTWRPAFHICLLAIPVFLIGLWWQLWNAPPLPGDRELFQAIAAHAGSTWLTGLSSHLLVATLTFLESVHYGVWILAMPLIRLRSRPWRLDNVPMARRSAIWQRTLAGFLLLGFSLVLILWVSFVADYPATRHVYFTLALVHVLAEVPFLLRAL